MGAIADESVFFWPAELQWEQLGNNSGLSEGWILDLSFSGATFLVHSEHFTRLICGYIKMFFLSSAPQWPSKLQWVISYVQMVVAGYTQLQEKGRDVTQGAWLTVSGKETWGRCTDILLSVNTTGCATSETKITGSQTFDHVVATPAAGLPSPEIILRHLSRCILTGDLTKVAGVWGTFVDRWWIRYQYLVLTLHYLFFNSDCTFLACSFYRQPFFIMAV